MKDYERLRKVLNWLVHLHHGVSKGGDETSPPSDNEWKECLEEAMKVLADTAETSEIEKLIPWLEEQRNAEDGAASWIPGKKRSYRRGMRDAYEKVLNHICTKLDYGGKQE